MMTTMNTGAASLSDEQKRAAITACALMIKGICLTTPNAEWTERIENRIHYLLRQIATTPQADAAPSELASMTRMFHAACADLGAINEALGLDPDDGGAAPILDAIAELKSERDKWVDAGYAASANASQADAAIAAGGAQEAARVDTGPNLEGLREKLLAPRSIERTSDGWLYHPDYPTCDEGTRADKFLEAFGIETAFVGMESDAPDLAERWHEEGLTDCSEWTPTPPGGDGWLLLEIYDTEDGPYALFGRDHYAAEQARKKEHTRRLSEAVRRARLERAAASNGEQA
jgi:hypothetical protein